MNEISVVRNNKTLKFVASQIKPRKNLKNNKTIYVPAPETSTADLLAWAGTDFVNRSTLVSLRRLSAEISISCYKNGEFDLNGFVRRASQLACAERNKGLRGRLIATRKLYFEMREAIQAKAIAGQVIPPEQRSAFITLEGAYREMQQTWDSKAKKKIEKAAPVAAVPQPVVPVILNPPPSPAKPLSAFKPI